MLINNALSSIYLIMMLLFFSKLFCSNKAMAMIISIEMIMASIIMSWLINEIYYDQIYFYVMFFCITVSEGVMGLSIMVSLLMGKSDANSSLFLSKI